MNKKVNILYSFFLMFSFIAITACKSIIEEDISDKKVIVNTPNATSLTSYNQLFWWEKVDGALNYQVQIASPSFSNVQKLLLDTITTSNKINFTLAAGDYEWHVRALNGSYQTAYTGSVFTITNAALNTQRVTLVTPISGKSVNTNRLTWDAIPIEGLNYRLIVSKSPTFTTEYKNVLTSATFYDLDITEETTYYWKVKAYSDTDSSLVSVTNSFTYDITAPDKVVLSLPTNNNPTLQTTNGSLTWGISNESNVKYIVSITYGTDALKTVTVTSTSYTYSAAQSQTVKWSVQAVDAAGNAGTASDQWTFKTGTSAARIEE